MLIQKKNLYNRWVSVRQDGPLGNGLIYDNLKSLFSTPSQYISKENKLTYRYELVHENWDVINFSNTHLSKDVYRPEDRVVENNYSEGVEIKDFLYARSMEYNDIYSTTFTNIGGEKKEVYGAQGVVENFSTDPNGNFEFQYYNEGSDLRTALSGTGGFPKEIGKKIGANRLQLKDFSLINEDGTYDIPIYRVTVYKNGKEIAKDTVNAKGRVHLNLGKALSELFKITYEKGIAEEREIPIIEKRIADNTLLKGEEKVVQEGEVGKEKLTYDKQFVNGKFFGKVNEKTEVIKPMKPKIIHYGTAEKLVNKTKETVKYDTIYEADQTLKYEEKKITQQGKNGSKEVTTTTTLVSGKRQESKNEVVTVKPISEIIKVGNKKVNTEKLPFKTVEKIDKTLKEGQTKVVTKGVNGKKITKITYKVDRTSGELTDPVSEVVEDTKPVDEVVLVGTKKVVPAKPIEDIAKTTKTTKETIKAKVSYEADDTLEFEKQNVVKKPVDGEKEVTTISQKGKKDVVTEKVIKDKVDGLIKVGNKKIEVDTKDGVTTTTITVYEVDKTTGKLVNPKVTVKKTAKIGMIEDIAKKVSSKDINYETTYVAKADLEYEKQEVFQKGVKGTKEITQVGSEKPVEKITKKPVDEIIGVGNKKVVTENVKVNGKDAKKITTTIYEVDKKTGKLINPKSTVKTILNVEKIEDIAKKVISAEKIQDIAKKVMPATKIEDIAKKTIPAKKIEDIAKKTSKDNEKGTIKATNSELKKTAHLPKAGTSSEILTLAVGALATISGASLSKKRRK